MKKIISFIALMLCAVTLFTACQRVPVEPQTDGTTTGTSTTDTPQTYLFMDLFSENLDQYVTLGDYKTIVINKNVGVSEEELIETIATEMQKIAVNKKLYIVRETAKGDMLNIDFAGKIDGVAFEGGTAEGMTISLTENTGYIPGFDKDLYGIMPGTTVSTTVTFPEDYDTVSLAGKEAVFEIKVNGIYDFSLTDENIKKLSDEKYESYEALKNDYKTELIKYNIDVLFEEIIKQLNDISNIQLLPEDQVNFYYYSRRNYLQNIYNANKSAYSVYYGVTTFEQYLSYIGMSDDIMKDEAKLMTVEDVLLIAAAKKLNCVATDEEIEAQMPKLLELYGIENEEALVEAYGNTFIKAYFTKEKVLKKLAEEIQLTSDYNDYKQLLDVTKS